MSVDANGEELPRFKLKVQDDDTGVVMAVGTDDLKAFMRDDLKKFLRQFRHNVEVAQQQQRAKQEAWAEHEKFLADHPERPLGMADEPPTYTTNVDTVNEDSTLQNDDDVHEDGPDALPAD